MDNPIINNYTNSPISREAGVRTNLSQTNTQLFNVGANFMPTERQTSLGVYNPGAVTQTMMEKRRYSMPRIYSPEGSPSAVSTENFLIAKSISAPNYTHNIAQTRYERTSNWMAEEPRFSNKVSLLA